MNITKLNDIELEYLLDKEINQMIVESLYPSESKQYKYFTKSYLKHIW